MVYRIALVIVVILCIAITLLSLGVWAAEPKDKGLYISPALSEITTAIGKTANGSLKIGNYTKQPLTVNLSIRQFSALDYTYDYRFSDVKSDWIKLEKDHITLEPGKLVTVNYSTTPPQSVRPGGHYYAFFASADMSDASFKKTAQVVSLLFMKVSGNLVQTGVIENGAVLFFNTGNEITYKFDARNNGNVHYSAFIYGQLESLFGKMPESGHTHILMPSTVKTIGGSVPSPLLPGIYKITYGFKSELSSVMTTKTEYILFIPPWSMVALAILIFGTVKLWQYKHRQHA